jgi:hypothetical protein
LIPSIRISTGDDEPEWVEAGDLWQLGMFSNEMWQAIDDAIEEQCKAEDAKRRKAAARKRRK